jgi:hypothetical protein
MFVQHPQFLLQNCPQNIYIWRYIPQSTHRVAIADFWRASYHWLVRVGGARLHAHPSQPITITHKVAVYAPAERADTLPLFHLYPYMYSVVQTIDPYPEDKEDVPHLDEDGLVGDADGALLLEVAGRLHKSSLLTRGIQCFMVNHWD